LKNKNVSRETFLFLCYDGNIRKVVGKMSEEKKVDITEEKVDNSSIENKIDKLITMMGKVVNKEFKNENIEIPEVPKVIEVEKIEEIQNEKEDEIIVEVGKEKKSLGYYISKFLVGG
jgi:hypothetical protein